MVEQDWRMEEIKIPNNGIGTRLIHEIIQPGVITPGGLLVIKELSIDTFETPFGRMARQFVEHPYKFLFRRDEFLAYAQQRGFDILAYEPHFMLYLLADFLLVARKEC